MEWILWLAIGGFLNTLIQDLVAKFIKWARTKKTSKKLIYDDFLLGPVRKAYEDGSETDKVVGGIGVFLWWPAGVVLSIIVFCVTIVDLMKDKPAE